MSAIEKPLYWYGAKTSAREVVLDIPIFARKGPVKTLWRVLHCMYHMICYGVHNECSYVPCLPDVLS